MSDIDLTKLDRPLGEYPDEVIGALMRACRMGAGVQYRLTSVDEWCDTYPSLHLDTHYRLAPEPPRPMSPPWDVLPEWVQAVTRDKNGSVYIFDQVPECDDVSQWMSVGGRCKRITYLRFDRGNMPWNESLVLRPGGNHE